MSEKITSVFVDTSVMITGILSARGYARDLLDAVLDEQIELVASAFVIEETRRNIIRKRPLSAPILELYLASLPLRLVDPPETLERAVALTIHLKDAPIVAAALTANVDYLATFDKAHLLSQAAVIKERFGLSVMTPGEILSILAGK